MGIEQANVAELTYWKDSWVVTTGNGEYLLLADVHGRGLLRLYVAISDHSVDRTLQCLADDKWRDRDLL